MDVSRKNRDVMVRALKIIQLFNDRDMTTKDIASELGVAKQSAGRWIAAASIVLPLAEVGTIREGNRGPEAIIYGLMR